MDPEESAALWVVIGYCIINFTIQEFIQPKIIGDSVNLSAAVTFISVGFWTWLIGAPGAILCIPLGAQEKIAVIGLEHSHVWGHLDRMIKGQPAKLAGIAETNAEPMPRLRFASSATHPGRSA